MEELEITDENAKGMIGADRMALGLSCIPHKVLGDMEEVKRLNSVIGKNNEEILRLKENKSLEKEIEEYKKIIAKMVKAINDYETLIHKMKCWGEGGNIEKDIIHRDVVPKCQFQSEYQSSCTKPISRISFSIPCCEEHAIERDRSLK